MSNKAWESIFKEYKIDKHQFYNSPFRISAEQIKSATRHFKETGSREVRILCKQDTRESRPEIFQDNNLFILPVKNGNYVILQGEGYIDIPDITSQVIKYNSKLDFILETSNIGNSEMQHLDFAYASSLVRTFLNDNSLVLTIRGRKYTPYFKFNVCNHEIEVKSVQTEVDAGYEGKNQIVLIEAKNSKHNNTIIRQLYYPFRQWKENTNKEVKTIFFEKRENIYHLWLFEFQNITDYSSIKLIDSKRFEIL